jgi:hypothetical protein
VTDRAERTKAHLAFLERQVAELEAVAEAATEDGSQISAAVSARHKATEMQKRIEQLRDWVARQPTKRPGKHVGKQPRALALIASGRSTGEVAEELGVDRSTVSRWRQDPEFAEALGELQSAQNDALHALLVAEQLDVARCLIAVATGPDTTDMARVHAGRVFFELLGRHKNAPVAPAAREGELESQGDVIAALKDIPIDILQLAISERGAERTAKAAARKRSTVKDL